MISGAQANTSAANLKTGGRSGIDMPVLVDLFCGAGGCTRGYQMAGFYVIGVDSRPQPRYVGDEFYQMDALKFVREYQGEVSAYSASPPCQAYSKARNLQGNDHPDLVAPVRELLKAMGKPYVIENVQGAPLVNPVMLVGSMFGLRTMRPRLFECSFDVPFVLAPPPQAKHAKMGRQPQPGEYVHVVGHMSDVPYCREAMGIDWMTQGELAQAIPPAYTKFIGQYLMDAVRAATPRRGDTMTIINSDIAVECPYCKKESNKTIGEVWFESETIKRQYCRHCDRYYFSAMSLVVSVETYKIAEPTDD